MKPELIREVEPTIDSVPNVAQEDAEAWLDEAGYSERVEDDEAGGPWPLGLIVVAVVALLLLGAGGYGVMQQRAAMQEEIRVLQAAVATSASPDEVVASRESQRILDERNTELQTTINALQMEIRSLQDTARGLEAQLIEAQAAAKVKAFHGISKLL